MDVVGFTVGPVQENAWLVSNDGRGVLVDPGEEAERLQREIAEREVKVEAILITHCHFDHVGAVAAMARSTGAPVYCPAGEVKILENINDYVRWPGFGPFEPYSPEHSVSGASPRPRGRGGSGGPRPPRTRRWTVAARPAQHPRCCGPRSCNKRRCCGPHGARPDLVRPGRAPILQVASRMNRQPSTTSECPRVLHGQ